MALKVPYLFKPPYNSWSKLCKFWGTRKKWLILDQIWQRSVLRLTDTVIARGTQRLADGEVVVGKGVGAGHMFWSRCFKKEKKNVCEITLWWKAEISDTIDLASTNASCRGGQLPARASGFCIRLGQTWGRKKGAGVLTSSIST